MIETKDFGKFIREERLKQNMTQTDVANQADILLPLFRMIEEGRFIPPLKTIVKIFQVLNLSVHELLTEEEKEILLKNKEYPPSEDD